MARVTGAQALVRQFYREGVRVVFGVPGFGQYEVVDALYEEPGIQYVSTRHEQAASFMADGYARAGGGIAVALVLRGPALFNALAGIATAYAASSPMLVITGTGHFQRHETDKGSVDWIEPITKWAAQIENPESVPSIVHEAFSHLRTGRPRPAVIEIPQTVLAARADLQLIDPVHQQHEAGDTRVIQEAAGRIAAAERPVIWAGSGAISADATEALREMAELLQAPVVVSKNGKGAFSDRHPLSLGLAEWQFEPFRRWLEKRDVILAVGTQTEFSECQTHQQIVRIGADHKMGGHHDLEIVGGIRRSLEELHGAVSRLSPAGADVEAEVRSINAQRFDPSSQLQPQWDFMRAIRSAIPETGVLVQGMTQMGYYGRNYYPVYAPRSYLTASYYSTLGSAFPLALGAKVARPNDAVVAIVGDGGFLYNSQELATAVQYGINVVVIVFNDNAYGNPLRTQIEEFNGHVLGTRLHNPDFVRLAEAYGVHGVCVSDAEKLESSLREAINAQRPSLIEVPVGMMERVY